MRTEYEIDEIAVNNYILSFKCIIVEETKRCNYYKVIYNLKENLLQRIINLCCNYSDSLSINDYHYCIKALNDILKGDKNDI